METKLTNYYVATLIYWKTRALKGAWKWNLYLIIKDKKLWQTDQPTDGQTDRLMGKLVSQAKELLRMERQLYLNE